MRDYYLSEFLDISPTFFVLVVHFFLNRYNKFQIELCSLVCVGKDGIITKLDLLVLRESLFVSNQSLTLMSSSLTTVSRSSRSLFEYGKLVPSANR